METTRIMKRFCRVKGKDIILLEESSSKAFLAEETRWRVILCRDEDEECDKSECEYLEGSTAIS